MCNKAKFYICPHCGNIIEKIADSGVTPVCCGEKMKLLEAGVVEASREKHIPEVKVEGDLVTVSVGSVEHPMSDEHSILWVYLVTDKGAYRKCLEVGKAPRAEFLLKDETALSAYAYCNLHGLWKKDI